MHRVILLHIPKQMMELVKPDKPTDEEARAIYDQIQSAVAESENSIKGTEMAGIINVDKFHREMSHHLESMYGSYFRPLDPKSVSDEILSRQWGKEISEVVHGILNSWSEDGERAYELLDLAHPELAHVMTEEDYHGTIIDIALRIFDRGRYKYGRASARDIQDSVSNGVAIFDARYYVNETPMNDDDVVEERLDPMLRRSYEGFASDNKTRITKVYSSLEEEQVKALYQADISHVFFIDDKGEIKLGRGVVDQVKYDWYAIGGRWSDYLGVKGHDDMECHGGIKKAVELPWSRIDVGWVREVLQRLWDAWHWTEKPLSIEEIQEQLLSKMSEEERKELDTAFSGKRRRHFNDNLHAEYRDQPGVRQFENFWKELTIERRPTKENPDSKYLLEYKVPSTGDSPTTIVDGIKYPTIRYCLNPIASHGLSVDELLAIVLAQTATPTAVVADAKDWIELPDSYQMTPKEANKRVELFKKWYDGIDDEDMIVAVDLHY